MGNGRWMSPAVTKWQFNYMHMYRYNEFCEHCTWLNSFHQIPLHLSLFKCCWRRRQLPNSCWYVVFVRPSPTLTGTNMSCSRTDWCWFLPRIIGRPLVWGIPVNFWCTRPAKSYIIYIKYLRNRKHVHCIVFLSKFSMNLLAFYNEYCSLIG